MHRLKVTQLLKPSMSALRTCQLPEPQPAPPVSPSPRPRAVCIGAFGVSFALAAFDALAVHREEKWSLKERFIDEPIANTPHLNQMVLALFLEYFAQEAMVSLTRLVRPTIFSVAWRTTPFAKRASPSTRSWPETGHQHPNNELSLKKFPTMPLQLHPEQKMVQVEISQRVD